MSLDVLAEKYGLVGNVRGILHGGCHLAEEAPDYDRVFGPKVPVYWIEANPEVFPKINHVLKDYPNQRLIAGVLSDEPKQDRVFNVTNYDGMSSSLLEFGTHERLYPDTVFEHRIRVLTTTLDEIVKNWVIEANMLVMDIQGAEGLALAGAEELLPNLDAVMLEVNKDDVYLGCAKIWDLDDRLLQHGLTRVETFWVEGCGWGDAFYCREGE